MQERGTVESFSRERGFGFIRPDNTAGEKLFLHIRDMKTRALLPVPGDCILYRRGVDKDGRPCAVEAQIVGQRLAMLSEKMAVMGPLAVSISFLVLVWLGTNDGWINALLIWPYGALSLLALVIYAVDKRAAQKDQQRIPEFNLHLLALFGGWPGALVARHALRHKTRKQPFRTIFWILVVVNIGLLILLFTPMGEQWLMERLP